MDNDEVKQRQLIVEQQRHMLESIDKLIVHIDKATDELHEAVVKLSISVMAILQVPIAVALIGVASWAFFFKYIDQWVWLIIMGVACFRYLGDSINGVVKLVSGVRRNGGNGK